MEGLLRGSDWVNPALESLDLEFIVGMEVLVWGCHPGLGPGSGINNFLLWTKPFCDLRYVVGYQAPEISEKEGMG